MENKNETKSTLLEDLIGESIIKIVAIEAHVTSLEFLLQGSENEEMRTVLKETRTQLRVERLNIVYLRKRYIESINERVNILEARIAVSYSATDKDEWSLIVKTLKAKVAMIADQVQKMEGELFNG